MSAPRVRARAQVQADIAALPAAHSVSSQGEAAEEIERLRDEAKAMDIEVRAHSLGERMGLGFRLRSVVRGRWSGPCSRGATLPSSERMSVAKCRHAAAAISLTAARQCAARAWSACVQRGKWLACWLREPV